MSQPELADKIGVVPQQVQKYESGEANITISKLTKISEALNTPVQALLPETVVHRGVSYRGLSLRLAYEIERLPPRVRTEVKKLVRAVLQD